MSAELFRSGLFLETDPHQGLNIVLFINQINVFYINERFVTLSVLMYSKYCWNMAVNMIQGIYAQFRMLKNMQMNFFQNITYVHNILC